MKLSKNRHHANRQNVPAHPLAPRGLKEGRSLKSETLYCQPTFCETREANFPVASSAAAVVGERVIVPTSQNCQRPIQRFCESFVSPNGTPQGRFAPSLSHARACLIRAPLNPHGAGSRGRAGPAPGASLTSHQPAGNCPVTDCTSAAIRTNRRAP